MSKRKKKKGIRPPRKRPPSKPRPTPEVDDEVVDDKETILWGLEDQVPGFMIHIYSDVVQSMPDATAKEIAHRVWSIAIETHLQRLRILRACGLIEHEMGIMPLDMVIPASLIPESMPCPKEMPADPPQEETS